MIKVKANSKINLVLDITGIKDNGYHSLFTIMQSVSLGDIISIERNESNTVTVSCDTEGVPTDSRNIVYKCAEKFFLYTGIENDKGIHIHIEKATPFGAGMGGGSADGAAVLVALNTLFSKNLRERELCSIGALVGADIPFCIVGGTALCLDTGSIVAPLPDMERYHIVIVKPECNISTKEAYDGVDSLENIKHPKNREMLDAFTQGNFKDGLNYCANVFEQAIEIPGRVDVKSICNKNGAVASCMTGSGSAVFGIFEKEADAKKSAEELKEKFDNVYICTPKKLGVEIIN